MAKPHEPTESITSAELDALVTAELEARADESELETDTRLPLSLLETWRADADRWQRMHGGGSDGGHAVLLLAQRVATLIDALLVQRRANVELGRITIEKATELEARLNSLRTELDRLGPALQRVSARREAFSAAPVQIEPTIDISLLRWLSGRVDDLGAAIDNAEAVAIVRSIADRTTAALAGEPQDDTPHAGGELPDDAPHGPLCVTLDNGCPDCLRLQRAAARKAAH